MYRNSITDIPYDDIDIEIRDLVKCMNCIVGVETESCCFGHNEYPCKIWFKAESIEVLNKMIFNLFDNEPLWKIEIDIQDVHSNWNDIHLVLTSGNIKDYPAVNLMVDNLTYRFKEYLDKS